MLLNKYLVANHWSRHQLSCDEPRGTKHSIKLVADTFGRVSARLTLQCTSPACHMLGEESLGRCFKRASNQLVVSLNSVGLAAWGVGRGAWGVPQSARGRGKGRTDREGHAVQRIMERRSPRSV